MSAAGHEGLVSLHMTEYIRWEHQSRCQVALAHDLVDLVEIQAWFVHYSLEGAHERVQGSVPLATFPLGDL